MAGEPARPPDSPWPSAVRRGAQSDTSNGTSVFSGDESVRGPPRVKALLLHGHDQSTGREDVERRWVHPATITRIAAATQVNTRPARMIHGGVNASPAEGALSTTGSFGCKTGSSSTRRTSPGSVYNPASFGSCSARSSAGAASNAVTAARLSRSTVRL